MKKIPLTQNKFALVDDDMYEELSKYKWFAFKGVRSFYAGRSQQVNGKARQVKMHRFIMNAPAGLYVDHINQDGLDNQKHNLRLVTASENSFNRPMNKNNKSGYRCIRWYKQTNKWMLQMKDTTVGYFANLDDAVKTYNIKAKEYWGDFAPQQIVPTEAEALAYREELLAKFK